MTISRHLSAQPGPGCGNTTCHSHPAPSPPFQRHQHPRGDVEEGAGTSWNATNLMSPCSRGTDFAWFVLPKSSPGGEGRTGIFTALDTPGRSLLSLQLHRLLTPQTSWLLVWTPEQTSENQSKPKKTREHQTKPVETRENQ